VNTYNGAKWRRVGKRACRPGEWGDIIGPRGVNHGAPCVAHQPRRGHPRGDWLWGRHREDTEGAGPDTGEGKRGKRFGFGGWG